MSLLLDALKRAEEAKRQREQHEAVPPAPIAEAPALDLAPLPDLLPEAAIAESAGAETAAADAESLATPELSLSVEPLVEVPPVAAATTPPAALPDKPAPVPEIAPPPPVMPNPAVADTPQEVAQRLSAVNQPRPGRWRPLALGLFLGIGVGALIWLFWPAGSLSPAVPPMPTAASATSASVASAASADVAQAVKPLASAPLAAPVTQAVSPTVARTRPRPNKPRAPASLRRPALAASAASAATAAEAMPRVQANPLLAGVNPHVAAGFAAYRRGQMPEASREYQQALQDEPDNRDALLGAAAVARNQGRSDEAARHYRKLLELQPQDIEAAAGLAAVRAGSGEAAESGLRPLAERGPDQAVPQVELANLYARQGRWTEAQAAYFRAHVADPANPDIAYNLAVSLERLEQRGPAADYYRRALALAQKQPARFDPAVAQARLAALSGAP